MNSDFRAVIRELADIADSYLERYFHEVHGVDKIFDEIELVYWTGRRLSDQIGSAPVDRDLLAAFMNGAEGSATLWCRFALFARVAAWNPLDMLDYPDGLTVGGEHWTWWSSALNPWGFERLPIRPVEYLVAASLMEEIARRLRTRAEAHLPESERRAACARWARRARARPVRGRARPPPRPPPRVRLARGALLPVLVRGRGRAPGRAPVYPRR